MSDGPPILLIGGTGVVGRPLARTLLAAGHRLRVLSRDVRRAGALLAPGTEIVAGDLGDAASIRRALSDCRAVVVSVSQPLRRRRPDFDPDREGMDTLLEVARSLRTDPLVIRTSAMGMEAAADEWWAAANKARSDEATRSSDLPHVILRPTWFVESLATTAVGPLLVRLPGPPPAAPDARLRWLAGEDYGRLVARILSDPSSVLGQTLDVHGAEEATMAEAVRAFRRPWRRELVSIPMPQRALDVAAMMIEPAAYLRDLLSCTWRHMAPVPREAAARAEALHRPMIGIEACSAELRRRGDLPRRRLS